MRQRGSSSGFYLFHLAQSNWFKRHKQTIRRYFCCQKNVYLILKTPFLSNWDDSINSLACVYITYTPEKKCIKWLVAVIQVALYFRFNVELFYLYLLNFAILSGVSLQPECISIHAVYSYKLPTKAAIVLMNHLLLCVH